MYQINETHSKHERAILLRYDNSFKNAESESMSLILEALFNILFIRYE